MKAKGLLNFDEDGNLCMKIRFSKDSTEEWDVPLEELLEEMIGKRIQIEVLPLKKTEEAEFE